MDRKKWKRADAPPDDQRDQRDQNESASDARLRRLVVDISDSLGDIADGVERIAAAMERMGSMGMERPKRADKETGNG